MEIILASTSPRRRELMDLMGLHYHILAPEAEEVFDPALSPRALVEHLAQQKCEEVQKKAPEGALVIAADTVVALEDRVLGKPQTQQVAREMLASLSGRAHAVYTGVCMFDGAHMVVQSQKTMVHMCALTPEEIDAYVATGEPMDKAGAYGIQGKGALFISGIEGDYFNVMGFPVCCVGRMLKEFGVSAL